MPIHHAVNRLSADTIIVIRPRHGLQVAAINLARERRLLRRRDMERFVLRLATECGASHRNQLLSIGNTLRTHAAHMTITGFNLLDRRINHFSSVAAGDAFLEHTWRPPHTIFRRIGWIYYRCIRPDEGLSRIVACHLTMLDAVAGWQIEDAMRAAGQLISFVDSVFDVTERGNDPAFLDCNLDLAVAV